jgi:hypothetical protein
MRDTNFPKGDDMIRNSKRSLGLYLALALVLVIATIAVVGCGTQANSSLGISASGATGVQASATTAQTAVSAAATTSSTGTPAAEQSAAGSANTTVAAATTTTVVTTATTQVAATTSSSTSTTKATTATTAGRTVLTVTGPSGTKTYTMAQLKAYASASGYWGPHKGDMPYSVNKYKGVPLLTLLGEVGGIPAGHSFTVGTTDHFDCVWDAARLATVDGGYQAWERATGNETTTSVTLIIAYTMDGKALGADVGPLRLVPVLSTDTLVTEGKYSPFFVESVTVQ